MRERPHEDGPRAAVERWRAEQAVYVAAESEDGLVRDRVWQDDRTRGPVAGMGEKCKG
jgi:hypothetical protein